MTFFLAFLWLADLSPQNSSPWDNATPDAYQTPCEMIPYFAANGHFAIGGIVFDKSDISKIEIIIQEFLNTPAITVTFSSSGHLKFQKVQQTGIGKLVPVCLNGRTILNPKLVQYVEGSEVLLSGALSLAEANTIKKEILETLENPANTNN